MMICSTMAVDSTMFKGEDIIADTSSINRSIEFLAY